jgi:hypothetical protein
MVELLSAPGELREWVSFADKKVSSPPKNLMSLVENEDGADHAVRNALVSVPSLRGTLYYAQSARKIVPGPGNI